MLLDHILGDARLCDLEPEHEQLAVDTRRSPKRVLTAHLPDHRAEVSLDLRSPSQRPRLPTPIAAKARTMPTHERFGRMIVRTFRIDGNQRYSWIKNQRSLFVSRTLPSILRRKTIN